MNRDRPIGATSDQLSNDWFSPVDSDRYTLPDELDIVLKCADCFEDVGFTDWTKEQENVVRCDRCGKRHHTNSLHAAEGADGIS